MDTLLSSVLATPYSPLLLLALKASLLLGMALAANALLRRAAASTRYFLISTAIFSIATLPVVVPALPGWQVTLPVSASSQITNSNASIPVSTQLNESAVAVQAGSMTKPYQGVAVGDAVSPSGFFVYLWLLGTAAVIGRSVLGMVSFSRIRRANPPAGDQGLKRVQKMADRASRRIGLRRTVPVMISDRVRFPQVNGLLHPTIVLPEEVVLWPEERLMSVLLHELAHIRRKDHITWPLANLVMAWLWFNPLVWLAIAQLRREREKACDDWVIASGTPNVSYAQHLLDVCAAMRTSKKLAPAGLLFARKNEVEERIIYMLNHKTNRRPVGPVRRSVIAMILLVSIVPLGIVHGIKAETELSDVTTDERDAIVATLSEFYSELSSGSEYQSLRDRFLTSDYFANSELTLENLDEAVQRSAFENTIALIMESGISLAREVRGRVMSIRREGQECVVTQSLNITARKWVGSETYEDEDGAIIMKSDRSSSGQWPGTEVCWLVKSLEHNIRFRKEDGMWKVSRFDDGVALMRMDTYNPYGPIFLFWMEDIDAQTTPYGPGIFKVIPQDIVPSAANTKFVLEN